MTRGRFGILIAAPVLVLCSVLPATTARAEDGGLQVTNVDVSDPPHVVVEVVAPAALTGTTLTSADVALTENGTPVKATLAVVPAAGLEVVLAIDTSGSMKEGDAIGAAKAAAQRFLAVLPAEVPVGVIAFADSPRLVSALSVDRALLNNAIGLLAATGETALYDGMVLARSVFSGATADRQIVLLSDGGNTVGNATLDDALAVAGAIRTSVVQLTSSEANPVSLQQLADANHGTLVAASDPAALTGLFETIANSLVHRYRLEFDSTATGEVRYSLTVSTADGPVSATATATVAPAESVPPDTDPSTVPASIVPASTIVASTSPSGGGGGAPPDDGTSSGLSADTWLRIGAACCFLALLLGLLALLLRRNDPHEVTLATAHRHTKVTVDPDDRSGIGGRVEAMADRALDRGNHRRGLAVALEVASINLRPGEFATLTMLGSIVLAFAMSTFAGLFGFVLGLVIAPLVAWMVVSSKADRRRRAFDDQLPDVLHLIVTLLQSGYGLPQALDAVSTQAAEPAATEFRRVLLEVRIGRDPTDALAATATRMKSRDFAWVVSAININREIGGELAAILDSVADTVRERQRLERQVRTLTAEGRLSAWVLTALPLLLVALLAVINPGYFAPMKETPGPQMIAVGVVLLGIGWVWMHRLITTHTSGR